MEITEESSITDGKRIKNRINKLKSNGLKIALDDFGSKHQNHDKLDEFEPEFIKLDKSIIKNQKPEVLERFTPFIKDYKVIVEGRNTRTTDSFVSLGFQYVQGYYICKPLDIKIIMEHIINNVLRKKLTRY
ncbi:EAL domain-containing protein [Peribacillus sp. S4]|uniref:EAL domain-containing protein n=1 Tax=Peribacillus sp. S4 TaxID=3384451 RepID=UPI003989C937